MQHEKVARLRQLMSEALPRETEPPDRKHRRDWLYFESNAAPLVLAQSPRARAQREIERIARTYGWQGEIERALDRAEAVTIDALDEIEISALRDRMRSLEECVQEGLDAPEAPPAR